MKRMLSLFLLAIGCCSSWACGAGNQSGNATSKANANGNAAPPATAPATKPAKTDAMFAKDAVEGLLNGDAAAADAFDWENLKIPGANAGEAYRTMPDEENKQAFRKDLIERYSKSFKASGSSVNSLTNWREQSKNGEITTVAADTATGKIMQVTVTHKGGQQKVSEIIVN